MSSAGSFPPWGLGTQREQVEVAGTQNLEESLTELDPDILERTSVCWYEPVKDSGKWGGEVYRVELWGAVKTNH